MEVHRWGPGGEAQLSRLEKEAFMSTNTHAQTDHKAT